MMPVPARGQDGTPLLFPGFGMCFVGTDRLHGISLVFFLSVLYLLSDNGLFPNSNLLFTAFTLY